MEISLGTVKSRLTRGREALKRRLAAYVQEVGPELGLLRPVETAAEEGGSERFPNGEGIEVAS
jgi:hypothetical protein